MCVHTRPTPLATTIMTGWAVAGGVLVASAAIPDWGASLTVPPIAWWAELPIGLLLAAGALLSLWATSRLQRDLKRRWRVDVLGMWLAASGWAGYTAISLVTEPSAWVHWIISATMCAGAAARIDHTGRQRRHAEAKVCAMTGGGGR